MRPSRRAKAPKTCDMADSTAAKAPSREVKGVSTRGEVDSHCAIPPATDARAVSRDARVVARVERVKAIANYKPPRGACRPSSGFPSAATRKDPKSAEQHK